MAQLSNQKPTFELELSDCQGNISLVTSFDQMFLESVDDVFSALGNQASNILYEYLEANCGISKTQMPHKTREFASALEAVFGSAARLIEIRILLVLHQKIPGFKFSGNDLSFVEYVAALRALL